MRLIFSLGIIVSEAQLRARLEEVTSGEWDEDDLEAQFNYEKQLQSLIEQLQNPSSRTSRELPRKQKLKPKAKIAENWEEGPWDTAYTEEVRDKDRRYTSANIT